MLDGLLGLGQVRNHVARALFRILLVDKAKQGCPEKTVGRVPTRFAPEVEAKLKQNGFHRGTSSFGPRYEGSPGVL